ncbi:hypothetical protein [Thiolapillus sp.]
MKYRKNQPARAKTDNIELSIRAVKVVIQLVTEQQTGFHLRVLQPGKAGCLLDYPTWIREQQHAFIPITANHHD